MKNKILWIILNLTIGVAVLLNAWLDAFSGSMDELFKAKLIFLRTLIAPVFVLTIVNYFILNWKTLIDYWLKVTSGK